MGKEDNSSPRERPKVLRNAGFVTFLTAATIFGPGYTPPLNPNFHHRIDKNGLGDQLFDWFVRPAPRVVMELQADGKLTHDMDWISTKINPSFQGIKMEGDPGLIHRENFFQGKWFEVNKYNFSKIQISLGAWWQAFQLKPVEPVTSWHFKFQGMEQKGSGQEVRIVFNGPIKVIQGDKDYKAYGEDDQGNEVHLQKTGPFPRWEKVEGDPI